MFPAALSRKKQSPIDLREDTSRVVHVPTLTLIGHWLNDGEATLVNTGKFGELEFLI